MDDYIYIEADEDVTSVVEKLNRSEGTKVALVAPRGSAILQSVVNLKLLKREAQANHKHLSLVTKDEVGKNLASQVGLTIYDEVGQETPSVVYSRPEPRRKDEIIHLSDEKSQPKPPKGVSVHEYWSGQEPRPNQPVGLKPEEVKISSTTDKMSGERMPIEKPKKNKKTAKQIFNRILVIIILLIIAATTYYFLPRADVNISIPSEAAEKTAKIEVMQDPGETAGAISALKVESPIEVTKNYAATGKKNVGEKAKGEVKITNSTGVAQNVSRGSTLSDGAAKYTVTNGATIPAATSAIDSNGNVSVKPGEGTVSVEATQSGGSYNRPAGADFTVTSASGEVLLKVLGTTANGFSGGSDKEIKIISGDDINKAKDAIRKDAVGSAQEKITAKSQGKYLFKDSIQLKDEDIKTPKADSEKENFDVTYKANAVALVFDESAFRQAVTQAIESELPSDQGLLVSSDDKVEFSLSSSDIDAGKMTIEGKLKTRVGPKIDTKSLITSIKGKSRNKAISILKNSSDITSVEVFINRGIGMLPLREKSISLHWKY